MFTSIDPTPTRTSMISPVNFCPVVFDFMNAMYDRVGPMQCMTGLKTCDTNP